MAIPATPHPLVTLKVELAATYGPDFEQKVTAAWADLLNEMDAVTAQIAAEGPAYLPSVDFQDLGSLSPERLATIKRRGTVIIRNVIPRPEADELKAGLLEFVKANPDAEGVPAGNVQYYQLFYTKPQVAARAHPNVLAASTWLNNLYAKPDVGTQVDLSAPLTYVDRFRIRQPGISWSAHPPHMDGGAIGRWQDPSFRRCFENILRGDWRSHDAYSLAGRLTAKTAGGLPNQASIFRTFQGWLALSETGPTQGTLKVFPDVLLSTAYIILRPFFAPLVAPDSPAVNDPASWRFDLSTPTFPGVSQDASAGVAGAARPFEFSPTSHPNLRLDTSMTSVPLVRPGDMVFWQCDVVHSVEKEHTGDGDSSVIYIPAVPTCAQNLAYVKAQAELFARGAPPPDFPQGRTEHDYALHATDSDITYGPARKAMGLTV